MKGYRCVEDVTPVPFSSSDNLTITVGGTVGACVIVIIGVVFVLFVIRLKRKSTSMAKRQSFMLEEKPFSKGTLKTEQSKLSNLIHLLAMTSWSLYMLCPRKQKEVLQPIKTFLLRI